MSLQFACVVDPSEDEALLRPLKKKTKTKGKVIVISSDSETEPKVRKKVVKKKRAKTNVMVVLEALTRREHALVLFHLIGKVLWNKRKQQSIVLHHVLIL